MNTVGQLASGIGEDLGDPTLSVTSISGWLASDRGIGKLNVQIGKEFIVDATGAYEGQYYEAGGYSGQYIKGDFYPALGNVEAAIFTEIYKYDYYDKKIRNALNGILDTTTPELDWNELSEGDTTIRRSNRNEVVKTYRGLQTDSKSELTKLVGYYRQNLSTPNQVTNQEPLITNSRVYLSWNRTHGC